MFTTFEKVLEGKGMYSKIKKNCKIKIHVNYNANPRQMANSNSCSKAENVEIQWILLLFM